MVRYEERYWGDGRLRTAAEERDPRAGGRALRRDAERTRRTPGGDFELAVGFLFTEGLIRPGDVRQVAYCDDVDTEEQRYNVITVALAEPFDETVLHRNFFETSSCGVCGKAALEDIEVRCAPIPLGFTVPAATIVERSDRRRSSQRVF